MENTIKLGATHYDVMGLPSTAGTDEIARAFTKRLSEPMAFGGIARLGLAYETLRDPDKRRTYDESIGLRARPQPAKTQWSIAGSGGATFQDRPTLGQAHRAALRQTPTIPVPPAESQAGAPVVEEPKYSSPLIDALRDLARPEPSQQSRVQSEPSVGFQAHSTRDQQRPADGAAPSSVAEPVFGQVADGPIDWKRPVVVLSGLAIGAAVLGIWLGWESENDAQAESPRSVVKASLPAAKPVADPTPQIAAPAAEEARPVQQAVAALAPAPPTLAETAAAVPEPQPAAAAEPASADVQEAQSATSGVDAVAEEAAPPPVRAAAMPLPNRVIARTIERIGYACGDVVTTAAVEGAPAGVFKVTCTSGQTYQARPVGGRYRFRRLGGQ